MYDRLAELAKYLFLYNPGCLIPADLTVAEVVDFATQRATARGIRQTTRRSRSGSWYIYDVDSLGARR